MEDKRKQRQYIAEELQAWVDFVKKQRDTEGLETTNDTYVFAPPFWPTVGTLENWIKVLKS